MDSFPREPTSWTWALFSWHCDCSDYSQVFWNLNVNSHNANVWMMDLDNLSILDSDH